MQVVYTLMYRPKGSNVYTPIPDNAIRFDSGAEYRSNFFVTLERALDVKEILEGSERWVHREIAVFECKEMDNG